MKNKNKQDVQSRREFFKKAAKSALPVIAAVALASAPGLVNAAEAAPMGCKYGCNGSCQSCTGTCTNECRGCGSVCARGCSAGCSYSSY